MPRSTGKPYCSQLRALSSSILFLFRQLLLPLGNNFGAFLFPFSTVVDCVSKVFVRRHSKDTAVLEFLGKRDAAQPSWNKESQKQNVWCRV